MAMCIDSYVLAGGGIMKQIIKFKELSLCCKIGIVGGWIYAIFAAVAFCVGFFSELILVL